MLLNYTVTPNARNVYTYTENKQLHTGKLCSNICYHKLHVSAFLATIIRVLT